MNKTAITVSAPGKLMLFGEHAVIYQKPCIVTAVNQRIYVKVETTDDDLIVVNAPDMKPGNYSINLSKLGKIEYPKEFKFILTSIELFFEKHKISTGIKIQTKSEFSSLFGFGSSSAVTVCVIKALSKIFDVKLDNKSLFDIAYQTVLRIQGVGSGFDLAAAIWGGTVCFVAGGKRITPIKVKTLPLVVGYTGVKADTTTLVRQVAELRKNNIKPIDKIFNSISQIVDKAEKLLKISDYKELGILMNKNQKLLVELGVSSEKLDILIKAANEAGAFGAKLSGAGGGDCMICLVDDESAVNVKKTLTNSGGIIIDVKTNAEGVRIE